MPYTRTQTGHGRNPCPVSPRSQSLPQGPGLPIPSPASQGAAQWGPPGPSPPWLHQPHGSDPTGLQITCGVLVLFCGFLVPGKGAEHAEGFLLVAAQAWVSPFTHFLARIKLFFFFFGILMSLLRLVGSGQHILADWRQQTGGQRDSRTV